MAGPRGARALTAHMKRINSNGRLSGQRGGNVVHRLDLPTGSRRRKRRRDAAPARDELIPAAPPENRLTGSPPVTARPAAPAPVQDEIVPAPRPDGDSQARHQIQLLERRLVKMARLLEEREKEISSVSLPVEEGVASIYREVQGLEAQDNQAEQKRELMTSIFQENVKLRERVTSGSSPAR